MIAHSVNTFRNCSVVHDLSTSKDYSTILYKCVLTRGKKLNESEKKQILELKQQQLSVFFFFFIYLLEYLQSILVENFQ